jgi:hypothetical protein
MFGAFRAPDEHLQVFECPVAVWTVISEDRLSSHNQSGYVFLTTNNSPIWNYINQEWYGKGKYDFALGAVDDADEKELFSQF